EDRYPTAADFVVALRDALHRAEAPTRVVRAPKRPVTRRRRPVWPLVAVTAAAVAGGGIAYAVTQGAGHRASTATAAAPPHTHVVTVKGRNVTVRETVTAQAPPPAT